MYYKEKLQYAAGGIILKTDRTDRKKRQKNSSETVWKGMDQTKLKQHKKSKNPWKQYISKGLLVVAGEG